MPKRKYFPIQCESSEVVIQAAETTEDGKTKQPTFDVVAYTGGALVVGAYDDPVVVDLDGMTFGKSLVANLDHVRTQRVGHVTERTIDGGKLTLKGVASASTPFRDEVVNSSIGEFPFQASIEAMPTKLERVDKGDTVEVNGRTFRGPLVVARKSTLKGFAFVSHGADDNTTVSIAASADDKERKMNAEFKAWITDMGLDAEELTDDQIANLQADFEGRPGKRTEPPKKNDRETLFEKKKREFEASEKITEMSLEAMDRFPHSMDAIRELAEEAIEAKWDVEKFQTKLLLSAGMPSPASPFAIHVREKAKVTNDLLECAVVKTANPTLAEKHFGDKPQVLEATDRRFPHGIGLRELFIEAANANGGNFRGNTVTTEVHNTALGFDRNPMLQASSGFSTVSLTSILSNSANKFLLNGWGMGDQAALSISAIRSTRDFKTMTFHRLTDSMTYEKIGPGGELPHGDVGEVTYTNKADTYGRMFAITRTHIRNDDLGALTEVPQALGVAAIDKFNNVFWTVFLDNSSFFAAGNNNVSTGAGSALDASDGLGAIAAAEAVFVKQTKPLSGEPLSVMPSIILAPPTVASYARSLMQSTNIQSGTDGRVPDANIWRGRFAVVTSPYMENANYTGNSAAAWYLLADPMRMAVMSSVFLDGRQAPVVETAEAAFNVLGVQMRGYHDFGCAQEEPRGGVRSAGS